MSNNNNNNAKELIAKRKKQIRIICYISLVFLVILLVLPPVCRILDKEPEEQVKQNVVTVINCNKAEESINSTFLNDEPNSITYTIVGNLIAPQTGDEEISSTTGVAVQGENDVSNDNESSTDPNNSTDDTTSQTVDENTSQTVDSGTTTEDNGGTQNISPLANASFYEIFKAVAEPEYSEELQTTSINVTGSSISLLDGFETNFKDSKTQLSYYQSRGFNCTKTDV